MCDTIIALGPATKDGSTIFGKNSDREPDEVQNLVIRPHLKHDPDEIVNCSYVTIPQVQETARVLLSQPFGCSGQKWEPMNMELSLAMRLCLPEKRLIRLDLPVWTCSVVCLILSFA